jgi:hypothetical protein
MLLRLAIRPLALAVIFGRGAAGLRHAAGGGIEGAAVLLRNLGFVVSDISCCCSEPPRLRSAVQGRWWLPWFDRDWLPMGKVIG